MSKLDPAYLVQEYNNQFWQPVYCSQMLQLARSHKLEFLTSATIIEAFDGCYPKKLLDLFNTESDTILRETLRDLAIAQSFRRDIYIKGGQSYWLRQKLNAIESQRFVALPFVPLPPESEAFKVATGGLSIAGNRDVYQKVIEAYGTQGRSLGEVVQLVKGQSFNAIVQITSLLTQGGWLCFESEKSKDAARALNQACAQATLEGAPYRYVSCPKATTATSVTEIDFMIFGLMNQKSKTKDYAKGLTQAMAALNKRFLQDGKAIESADEALAKAQSLCQDFTDKKLPAFQALGAM
jgi:hypothetical protein